MLPPGPESFAQPDNPFVPAWRHLDLSQLLASLINRELRLVRLDLLPDKYEGTLPAPVGVLDRIIAAAQSDVSGRPKLAGTLIDNHAKKTARLRRSMYVSCWRLGAHESDAMWRLYSGSGNGLAMVTPYCRLRELALASGKAYVGRVRYMSYETDLIDAANAFDVVMHKRKEFEYENEARIVSCRRDRTKGRGTKGSGTNRPLTVPLPWTPEDVVERIVISPYAAPWFAHEVRKSLSRIAPSLASRIQPSSMGRGPYL